MNGRWERYAILDLMPSLSSRLWSCSQQILYSQERVNPNCSKTKISAQNWTFIRIQARAISKWDSGTLLLRKRLFQLVFTTWKGRKSGVKIYWLIHRVNWSELMIWPGLEKEFTLSELKEVPIHTTKELWFNSQIVKVFKAECHLAFRFFFLWINSWNSPSCRSSILTLLSWVPVRQAAHS